MMSKFAAAIAGAAFCVAAAAASAQQIKDSYSFMGLKWGMNAKEAQAQLATRGFRFNGNVAGPAAEFAVQALHGASVRVDRGRRLQFLGNYAGQAMTVHLVFGANDQLGHVIMLSRDWDKTVLGAKRMIRQAETVVQMLEEQYGPAQKHKDDGWVDTAVWPQAKDGSRMALHVRGEKGFMFSPSFRTALRVDFEQPRLSTIKQGKVSIDKTPAIGDLPKIFDAPAAAPAQAKKR
jgi:hypothetical protein